MTSLGELIWNRGDYESAHALLTDVVEKQRRVLGEGHKHTLRSMYCLGRCLWSEGNLVQAKALLGEVWEKQRMALGEDHSDTRRTMEWVRYIDGCLSKEGLPMDSDAVLDGLETEPV